MLYKYKYNLKLNIMMMMNVYAIKQPLPKLVCLQCG